MLMLDQDMSSMNASTGHAKGPDWYYMHVVSDIENSRFTVADGCGVTKDANKEKKPGVLSTTAMCVEGIAMRGVAETIICAGEKNWHSRQVSCCFGHFDLSGNMWTRGRETAAGQVRMA